MFRKLFGREIPLSPAQYQAKALEILRGLAPARTFAAAEEPLIVLSGKDEFGLQNLYASYLRDRLSGTERDEDIRTHFTRMLARLDRQEEVFSKSWSEIQPLLRPQLMPPEYGTRGISLLTYAFASEVVIGLVVDLAETYAYVRTDDPGRWGMDPDRCYQHAVRNLDAASIGVEMHVSEGPEKFLAIEAKDGYDAARILLPSIRSLAVERLGTPCLGAIPNRDFLFFWSTSNSPAFQVFTRNKLARDFEEQPYPLTPAVFSVTRESVTLTVDA